jgi:flagellar capping protein FliD
MTRHQNDADGGMRTGILVSCKHLELKGKCPMAATATDEKLAADLASFRSEVARDLAAFRGEVTREFHSLAEFRGEVKIDLRWIKAIGATLLLAAFSFAGWILTDMATLKTEVRQQEKRLDTMDTRFDKVDARLDKMDTRLDKMDTRLDKIETKMDTRFDKIEKKLETLIERTAPKAQ